MGTSFGFRAPGRETTPLGLDRQQVSADRRDTIAQRGSGDIPHAAADAPRRGAARVPSRPGHLCRRHAGTQRRRPASQGARRVRPRPGLPSGRAPSDVTSDLAEPFKTLLGPEVKTLLDDLEANALLEPDWAAWEASFNDNTHGANLAGVDVTRRPHRGRGLNYELMVGAGGFEPP